MYIQPVMKANRGIGQVVDVAQEPYWEAVVSRDANSDGRFVFAVSSTMIYCKPSCPSRRPTRERVEFFPSPDRAEVAGYRACLRCKPRNIGEKNPRVEMVERVCRLLEQETESPQGLDSLARAVGSSPSHLQRTFKKIMGVSPRQYAESWRLDQFKKRMKEGADVTTAMYEAGYGSSSRLYEKSAAQLGMTPGAYGRGGASMAINYTIVDSALGKLLVAGTERGLCSVTLGDDERALEEKLRSEFEGAELNRDPLHLDATVGAIVEHLNGQLPHLDLPLDVRATAFQKRVWEELQKIPYGATRSYGEVAAAIGRPTAFRAVARACATNPVALVVPCHRVVREGGALGGYRWGLDRKKKLLDQEKATGESGTRGNG
jgi:AraC family transcriptional regulator of adaptative response/methylated-DNA-[protein]-cysteine methyltransferase